MKPKFNAAFWKWFGNSVVRNEDGSPKVVYHGTTSKRFSVFDPLRFGESVGRPSLGFWFSSEKWMADMYSDGKTPIQLFIKVENPLFIPSSDVIKSKRSPEKWATHAKEHGFDGLILEDKNSYVYGVFDNKQIKSVANDGTWDADDPDIRSNPPGGDPIERDLSVISKSLRSKSREWAFFPESFVLKRGDAHSVEVSPWMSPGGWIVHNHPSGPFLGFSYDDTALAEKFRMSRMDVVYPRHGVVITAKSDNGQWWQIMPRTYLEQVAMQNGWKARLRSGNSCWSVSGWSLGDSTTSADIHFCVMDIDEYEWTRLR
jgi:hypothetical protein